MPYASSMSSVETTTKPQRRLLPKQRAAIIAALGAGHTQAELAQQYGVHPNTIYNLWKLVRQDDSPSNPASNDWKSTARHKAQKAVERGLDHASDVIGSANIGLKVLYGIGDLVQGANVQVAGNVALTVSWLPVTGDTSTRTIDAQVSDVSDSKDSDSHTPST